MGERKGQNMYYPPDYDPGKGGLNKSQGTHALRERAKKLHLGILIIRFEMPYNIWCEGCGNHIGMGVRYNAEKKKVGMYYTTPVYLFRMKCHLCDNHFEIKTDPGNLDYEIISGARRQEKRFKAEENGTVVPNDKSDIAKLTTDSMFKLQHDGIDRGKGKDAAPTIAKIVQIQDRAKDDYGANRLLRDAFRSKRKEAKSIETSNSEIMLRASLKGSEVKLLPEEASDSKTAALLRLAPLMTSEEQRVATRDEIMEDGSIFDFAKPLGANNASKRENINNKEKIIENFKKSVARKRHRDTSSASSLNLGIRKRGCVKRSNNELTNEQKDKPSDKREILNVCNDRLNTECDELLPMRVEVVNSNMTYDNSTSNLTSGLISEDQEEISKTLTNDSSQSKNIADYSNKDGEHSKKSSLALLSCDYESSNSSSDE